MSDEAFDFLFFSSSDWAGLWGSRQQVAGRLAALGHRVLFVEKFAGLEHFMRHGEQWERRKRRWREGVIEQQPNLWLAAPPALLPGRFYAEQIAAINAQIVVRWLQPIIEEYSFHNPILWLYKPEHVDLIGRFGESKTIYHCIDEFTVGTTGIKKRVIERLEGRLLQEVDLVFANSLLTYERKRPLSKRIYQIPSGADVAHFGQTSLDETVIPEEMAQLEGSVLVYVGGINEKIDGPLLLQIATQRPAWQIVLIGRELGGIDLRRLKECANVHFFGKRPFAQLPAYLKRADVCLLPYVQGEATLYRSPLKLYEYLATGKPIVSTPHPEVDQFAAYIKIAEPDQFVAGIEQLLRDESGLLQEKRLQVAKGQSWDIRVAEMLEQI